MKGVSNIWIEQGKKEGKKEGLSNGKGVNGKGGKGVKS